MVKAWHFLTYFALKPNSNGCKRDFCATRTFLANRNSPSSCKTRTRATAMRHIYWPFTLTLKHVAAVLKRQDSSKKATPQIDVFEAQRQSSAKTFSNLQSLQPFALWYRPVTLGLTHHSLTVLIGKASRSAIVKTNAMVSRYLCNSGKERHSCEYQKKATFKKGDIFSVSCECRSFSNNTKKKAKLAISYVASEQRIT